jgi:S1-C subfamily serine protease
LAIPIRYYLDQEQAFKQRSLVSQKPWLGFYPHLLAGHVVVGGVTEGSPAERQGLKEGDIILDVEKTQIRSRRQLYQELWKKRPGERICLRVLRNETSIELNLIGADRRSRYGS